MNSRRFLNRTKRRKEARLKDKKGFNPSAMIKLSGFGAALVVGAAVYVGFAEQGDTIYSGTWGILQRLVTPLFFGVNALELLTIVVVAAFALHIWKNMRS